MIFLNQRIFWLLEENSYKNTRNKADERFPLDPLKEFLSFSGLGSKFWYDLVTSLWQTDIERS